MLRRLQGRPEFAYVKRFVLWILCCCVCLGGLGIRAYAITTDLQLSFFRTFLPLIPNAGGHPTYIDFDLSNGGFESIPSSTSLRIAIFLSRDVTFDPVGDTKIGEFDVNVALPYPSSVVNVRLDASSQEDKALLDEITIPADSCGQYHVFMQVSFPPGSGNTDPFPYSGNIGTAGSIQVNNPSVLAPSVQSINRLSPAEEEMTDGGVVTWQVTFSEAVTGADSSDFSITRTSGSISGFGLIQVQTMSPEVATVTANTGTGIGVLRLDVVPTPSIYNDCSMRMITGFTNGNTYSIIGPGVPELAVLGNGTNIVNGDNTPSVSDYTDFGTLILGDGIQRNFTIQSVGTGNLAIGPVTVTGTNAADFIVTVQPGSVVAHGGSATLQISFNPSAIGLRTAMLSFTNNDSDESPFRFTIQGFVVAGGEPGSVDPSYSPLISGTSYPSVFAVAIQPDGKAVIGGGFTAINGVPRNYFARVETNGAVDGIFNPIVNVGSLCAAVQLDGKILVGGGVSTLILARLNANGTQDTSFNPGVAGGGVRGIVIGADGKIIIHGGFTSVGGVPRYTIARLNPDGTLDTTFNTSVNIILYCAAVQPDGKIIIGGNLTTVGGVTRNGIARLNTDGTLDSNFNPNVNSTVLCVAIQSDGKILIGGYFSAVGVITRNRIARLHPDGAVDMEFNPSANNDLVGCITLQADGKILIGGNFGIVGGATRPNLARLNSDGSADSDFDPRPGGLVEGSAIQADGKILISGGFSVVGTTVRHVIARLNNYQPTGSLYVPDLSRVVWNRGGSAPEVTQVNFDLSTDGGTNWTPIGMGTRVGTTANWQRAGISLPVSGWLRARGRTVSGYHGGSSGLVEQIAQFPTAPVRLTGTTWLSNGAFQFGFTNVNGATFTILCTSNILQPLSNWTEFGRASEISPGQFQFRDTSAATNTHRYYLIRSP